MQLEIEAKFLKLDHDQVRHKLQELGAELRHPMRLMRRTLLDYPDKRLENDNWGRLRVRDEGDKITLTYKSGGEKEYSQETETTVGSYEVMIELLESIGLVAATAQESKRETWQMGEVEVVLDIWPWLTPYIEIEGPSEQVIQAAALALRLDWKDAVFGNVDTAYRRDYPGMTQDETITILPNLAFSSDLPAWLKARQ
jgi:adenylate cyclase class 2